MNILLISQCNKRALVETRRILDQFAERKGERTWQTAITQAGLTTLRKILRQSARRNTAVACHWIKGANQSELLWIVGNLRQFNAEGAVPTHSTERDILKSQDENRWYGLESIGLLAAIAGLFHDFGKANQLFQQKLQGKGLSFEPYRHEWVSLRLFQAFVGQQTDDQWLQQLSEAGPQQQAPLLKALVKDRPQAEHLAFPNMPPIARMIAWLILAHHRLPAYPQQQSQAGKPDRYTNPPQLKDIDQWMDQQLNACWNSTNSSLVWQPEQLQQIWQFPHGTPLCSPLWCAKAQKFARRALAYPALAQYSSLEQRFTSHMARLVLMLADHHYSSQAATVGWQSDQYPVWANTDRKTGAPKQHLDEHNIGVGQNAWLLARSLPAIRKTLPAITRHKGFKQRTTQARFRWQNKAYDLACALREPSQQQGFFGINMASTGCGKTLANARIMYGLADEKQGCRFSVALGLRTLTLQTGDALQKKLWLEDDDLAVMIGSQAVQQLHQRNYEQHPLNDHGSASADELFAEHQYVRYDGSLDDGRLSSWLRQSPTLHKLLSAPILVSTIDHLMPATEGTRGGKQIAPMLRLLTADLVLDEPDDFDIEDLYALCRLVNWAGMLGCRVLLSSATLTPAQVQALFIAYRDGRADYQQVCGQPQQPVAICCAWFDENGVQAGEYQQGAQFNQAHQEFVACRVAHLQQQVALRKAVLMPVVTASHHIADVVAGMTQAIADSLWSLHTAHHQTNSQGQTLSLGLVRMANIDPLVAIAQQLLLISPPENTRVHYCVYHSQHPLATRSYIEQRLDSCLARHQPEQIWQQTEIQQALARHSEQHHLFVVLATAVAEVGRDHDYDWAIVEPSSMRSIIQLAGRIQRHRQQEPLEPNLYLLRTNIKALRQPTLIKPAYCRPGFETNELRLVSHDLAELLTEDQYRLVSAIPRIQPRNGQNPTDNLVDLEHYRLLLALYGSRNNNSDYCAALWWRHQATWSGELQRRKPFRQFRPDQQYYLCLEDADDKAEFYLPDTGGTGWKKGGTFDYPELDYATGVSAWLSIDISKIYQDLADDLNMELMEVSQRFGEINLPDKDDGAWFYHPLLGGFGALK